MTLTVASRLAEQASNGVLALAKKPLEYVRQASLAGVNAVTSESGYHEVCVGAERFRTVNGGTIPETKYVDVIANNTTTIVDRCANVLLQKAKAGHVATSPLMEATTTYKVTIPVLTDVVSKAKYKTGYTVTALSVPDMLRIESEEMGGQCGMPDCLQYLPKSWPNHAAESSDEDGESASEEFWQPLEGTTDVDHRPGSSGDEAPTTQAGPLSPRRAQSFQNISDRLASLLHYDTELPRDDIGAISCELVAGKLGITASTLAEVVVASQGDHHQRFEHQSYGEFLTVRAKYLTGWAGPELVSTAYNTAAAKAVVSPGEGETRNTLGLFNDLFPDQKYAMAQRQEGPDHNPLFHVKVTFRGFEGRSTATTLKLAKALAMGKMLAAMLAPNNDNLSDSIIMNNRQKKTFRAYGCLGQHNADQEFITKITRELQRRGVQTSRQLAANLGVTIRSVNSACYHNKERFTRTSAGWKVQPEQHSPMYSKVFGRSATSSILGNMTELRELVEFHLQLPARYAEIAMAITAGNAGTAQIAYISTRFRTIVQDDDEIDRDDKCTYVSALTLLSYASRYAGAIPGVSVELGHAGHSGLDSSKICWLTDDEKFKMLTEEARPRAGAHVLASYDATDFTGDFNDIRTVVLPNPGGMSDPDQPYTTYRCAQVAPNYFGLPGPLDTSSPATWLSAIMRNMSNGTKELCPGVVSDIKKHRLEGETRKMYDKAIKIVARGDAKALRSLIANGSIGPDFQKPPSKMTAEQAAELYAAYGDWYDRVGEDHSVDRCYKFLGVLEKERPEIMKTFLKSGEVDTRGRMIQPTAHNDAHTVCNGNVVKVIAETVRQARPANLFKGLTEGGKERYFGELRKVAAKAGAKFYCFDRSKQDWLTSLQLLEAYEDYMDEICKILTNAGFDLTANTMFRSRNKATKCTLEDFIILTDHAMAMLTSACAQTSEGNRFKTEVETLALMFMLGYSESVVQSVYDSWNNPAHRTLVYDEAGNEVYVPNEKMKLPMKYEGDDLTLLDLLKMFKDMDHTHMCRKIADFNGKFSTSWIPSDCATEHGPLDPIDTLSTLYFADPDRDEKNQSTKIVSGRPDWAIPHPVKKAKSIVTMYSPTNIKFDTSEDGVVSIILDDKTRIAIATAKTAQAEGMKNLLWLRRVATASADYFLKGHKDTKYMKEARPIWDPRAPEARGVAPDYDEPVVKRLVDVDDSMPGIEGNKEFLIANAQAWRLTAKELKGVSVEVLAGELAALDVLVGEGGIDKADFDIRYSFNSVRTVAPHIATVCERAIGRSVARLEGLGAEGSLARVEEQKEAVKRILSVGSGKWRNNSGNAATNEQSPQRHGGQSGWYATKGDQRRGQSAGKKPAWGDRTPGSSSATWRKW